MQQEISSSATSNMMQVSPPPQPRSSISDLFAPSPFPAIFFHPNHSDTVSPATFNPPPDPRSTAATTTAAAAVTSLSRILSEHRDLINRHTFCLSQLRKTFKEAETLRQENTNLRVTNFELTNQLTLLLQAAALQSHYQTASFSDSFSAENNSNAESPTSVIPKERSESQMVADPARVSLPKSISVRSNGYLKVTQGGGALPGPSGSISASVPGGGSTKVQSVSPVSGPKKVYVRGGNKKDGPIELEVYNQGMFKTELCNKWQETGDCPYGDHCQFAHGIKELRPVIRHPRYKTEVCRMVLAGDPCPYGHRCHFRHTLTEQEKLMLPLRLE